MLFLAWGAAAWIEAGYDRSPGAVSPRFVPAFSVGLLGLLLLWRILVMLLPIAAAGQDKEPEAPAPPTLRGVAAAAATLVYATLLSPLIGFYAASIVFFFVVCMSAGERRPLVLAGGVAVLLGACYLLFEQLMQVRLPHGALWPWLGLVES